MKTRVILVAALALVACGKPGDPRSAWLGVYGGTWASEARDCETGAPLMPLTDAFDIEIITVGDHIAIDGGCLIEWRLTDSTHARLIPSTCNFVLTDGTPVRIEYISGDMQLDRDEVGYTIGDRYYGPTGCDVESSTFVGLRR